MAQDDKPDFERTTIDLELPSAVVEFSSRAKAEGAAVYVVGGAVRDSLLGWPTQDWDLATGLAPERVAALAPGPVAVDSRLGVAKWSCDGGEIAVTTFREEGGYADHRRPATVKFVDTPEIDASRRDFTINSIYVEVETGRVVDPNGGIVDLAARVLRVIGNAEVRLAEDPLRMLRAVRFAAAKQLIIDPVTRAALVESASVLGELSSERVFEELSTMFTGPGRGTALRLLIETGLAAVVLPEVVGLDGVPQPPEYHPEGDVLTHVCMVLDEVWEGDLVQAWSAVLHDVGKPATFERAADRIRFSGHDVLSAEMADAALERLRAPRALRDTVVDVCRDHIRFASILEMKPGKRTRWLRSPDFGQHLAFHRADCAGSHGKLDIHDAVVQLLKELPAVPPPPLCGGADVLALGVAEGPAIGEVLAQLRGKLDGLDAPDRATALRLLASIVDARVKGGCEEDD